MADKKAAKLEEDLKAKTKEVETLTKRVEELTKAGGQTKSLEEKVASLTEHNEKLLEKTQHLNIEITTLKKNFEAERAELKATIKTKDDKIEELTKKLRDTAKSQGVGNLQAENETLSAKVAELTAQVKLDSKTIAELEEKLKNALANKETPGSPKSDKKAQASVPAVSTDQRLEEQQKAHERLEKKYQARIAELERDKHRVLEESTLRSRNEGQVVTMNNNKIEELTRTNLALNKKILDLENALKQSQAIQAKIEEKVAKEKKFFENERTRNDTLRAENKQQFNLIKKKDAEIKDLRTSLQDQSAQMEKKLGEFKKQVGSKTSQDTDYTDMKQKFDQLKQQLNEKDKYIVELGKTQEKHKNAVGEVKGNLEKTFTAKIKLLQNQLHERDLEVKVLNQMIVSANKMVQMKTTELQRLQGKVLNRSALGVVRESSAADELSAYDGGKNSRLLSSAQNLRSGSAAKYNRQESAKRASLGLKYARLPNPNDNRNKKSENSDFLEQLDRSLLQSAYKGKTLEEVRNLAAEDVK